MTFVDFLKSNVWLFQILCTLVILFLLIFSFKRVVRLYRNRLDRKESFWGQELRFMFHRPIELLLWVIALSYIFIVLGEHFEIESFIEYVPTVRLIAIVLIAAWFLFRFKKSFQKVVLHRRGKLAIDPVSIDLISKIASIVLLFVVALIVLQIAGLNILPILTVGGIGAAIIGFASKDVISNFFGGLMLYATRPFVKGDLIDMPSQNLSGHVEEVGWYLTRIRDLQKKPMYVPNALFSNSVITNLTRMSHRKIEEKIGIAYKDFPKMLKILNEISALLKNDPEIDQNLGFYVYFTSFAPYSLEILIKAYTVTTNEDEYYQVKQNILLQVGKIITDAGAEIPFPTTMTIQK